MSALPLYRVELTTTAGNVRAMHIAVRTGLASAVRFITMDRRLGEDWTPDNIQLVLVGPDGADMEMVPPRLYAEGAWFRSQVEIAANEQTWLANNPLWPWPIN